MNVFTLFFCDAAHSSDWLNDERLLALIQFAAPLSSDSDLRHCRVALPEWGTTTTAEVWLAAGPVRRGVMEGIYHASDDKVLFLNLHLDESAPTALESLTTAAYQRLFAVARALGYPHFLRIWNYFSEINREYAGFERYRTFCAGRHQALMVELTAFETQLPAASAIGTQGSGFHLYALAAREPGVQIENPRQISAFHYPPQYGHRSPSFSRAVLKDWGGNNQHLYISGTASIVGHTSQHHHVLPQLDETLANLKTVLAEGQRRAAIPLSLALLKIYLRPHLDPAPLRARIAQAFGAETPLLFLRADICRRELLIEIEGLATSIAARHPQDYAS